MYRRAIVGLVIAILNFNIAFGLDTKKFSDEELCYMPVAELLKLFRNKELSPVDVLNAQIRRIKEFNPKINAISYEHYKEALAQAKESEKRYQNGNPRPLEGITCAIKDDIEVKGWKRKMGSLIMKDAPISMNDSPIMSSLRNAGVIMHIQTNVPEYYCNLVTWNLLSGITRNPWNLLYTPGGSSGGSAAALAAGFTTLATGSDMGGSIRFPAAITGLYGFKPPYGRVATSQIQYESVGPMARTFEDIVLFQNSLAGPNVKMISALRPKLEYPNHYGNIKGWRIAYDPMNNWGMPIDDTIRKAMIDTVKKLRTLGAIVEEIDIGFRAKDFDTYALGIFSTSVGPFCFNEASLFPHLTTPYIKYLIKNYANNSSSEHLSAAEDWIDAYNYKIQKRVFLKGYRAIIMPTMVTPYILADMGSTADNNFVTINNKQYQANTWIYSFTWPWNMLGQYPVLNVPIGITPEGIPIGMQVIGNIYEDLTVFQFAANWSKIDPQFYYKKTFLKLIKSHILNE